jgi:hypothetical protein
MPLSDEEEWIDFYQLQRCHQYLDIAITTSDISVK